MYLVHTINKYFLVYVYFISMLALLYGVNKVREWISKCRKVCIIESKQIKDVICLLISSYNLRLDGCLI